MIKQNGTQDALIRYNKTLDRFPYDTNALTKRGELLFQLGRFQEAVEDLNKVIELDPYRKDPAANHSRSLIVLIQEALNHEGKP